MRLIVVTAMAVAVVGCGSSVERSGTAASPNAASSSLEIGPSGSSPVAPEPTVAAYAGPMYVKVGDHGNPDVRVRAGAAVGALECSGEPYLGQSNLGHPDDNAAVALAGFVKDNHFALPPTGYRVERQETDRVLYSYDVDGRTKVAVIVGTAPREGFEQGWYVESFATCNPFELPDAVTDALGVQVWTNEKSERVPTTAIQSAQGPTHCNWESATFLTLGRQQYIRDPDGVVSGGISNPSFRTTFDGNAALPVDATDTGYRLDGQALWMAADKLSAYVVGADGKVERWPAPVEQVGCA